MTRTEIWKPVVGYEGSYEVSNLGRVRSVDRTIQTQRNGRPFSLKRRGRELTPSPKKSGHLQVHLRPAGVQDVHVLVMRAFVGPYPAGTEIRHLNGVAGDPCLSNLEYATRGRNLQDRKHHDLPASYKLRPNDVRAIRRATGTQTDIAAQFGVSQSTISLVRRRELHTDV